AGPSSGGIASSRRAGTRALPELRQRLAGSSAFTVRLYDIRFDATGGTELALYLEVRQSVGCDPASVSSRKGVLLEERNSKRRRKRPWRVDFFFSKFA
ncbi:MAG: hypothetical protein WAM44_03740, partial [Chthoniobacterales bacterium]